MNKTPTTYVEPHVANREPFSPESYSEVATALRELIGDATPHEVWEATEKASFGLSPIPPERLRELLNGYDVPGEMEVGALANAFKNAHTEHFEKLCDAHKPNNTIGHIVEAVALSSFDDE